MAAPATPAGARRAPARHALKPDPAEQYPADLASNIHRAVPARPRLCSSRVTAGAERTSLMADAQKPDAADIKLPDPELAAGPWPDIAERSAATWSANG